MVIPLYYINLDRRPDRNRQFLQRNSFLKYMERFPAIDGSTLCQDDLLQNGVIAGPLPAYTAGAMGCALSHKKLWELAASRNSMITIAEDDVYFREDFEAQSVALIGELPPSWDLVYWGYNLDSVLQIQEPDGQVSRIYRFDQGKILSGINEFRKNRQKPRVARVLALFGLCAYTLTPRGATKLLSEVFPLKNDSVWVPGLKREVRNIGIDVVMNRLFPHLETHACYLPLAIPENDKARSDIQKFGQCLC